METTCLFCNQILYPECQDACYFRLKDRICSRCLEQSKPNAPAQTNSLSGQEIPEDPAELRE